MIGKIKDDNPAAVLILTQLPSHAHTPKSFISSHASNLSLTMQSASTEFQHRRSEIPTTEKKNIEYPYGPQENESIKSSSSASNNIPHHPPHHPPHPPHRLPSIIRIQKIKPFGALHLQAPPFLRRRVEIRLRGAVGDEIEVAVIDADVDEGDVVVERGDEVDLRRERGKRFPLLLFSSR